MGGEADAAIGVGAEVLDVAGEDFVVANGGVDVVGGIEGGAEEADGADGAGDSADADELKGRRMMRKMPAAKEVVSMPKTPRTAMARAMLRVTEMLARK